MSKSCPCGKKRSGCFIQCYNENCEVGWWHAVCCGFNKDVSKKQLDAIGHWTCPCCVIDEVQIPGYKLNSSASQHEVISKLDENLNQLRSEIADLKKVKDEFANMGKDHKEVQLKWSDIAAKAPCSDEKFASTIARCVVDHSHQVQSERESRENNVIMFNANEPDSSDASVRKQHDQNLFDKICSHVLDKTLPVKNIIRIGKRQESVPTDNEERDDNTTPEKPRPIKVCFSNNFDKRKFLSSLHKLDDASPDLKQISVKHDLSTEERQRSKELFSEARRRNETESPADFLYKVRGPPHAMKIVKVYKKH